MSRQQQQPQARQRQKRDPLGVEDQARLKERLNASYAPDILSIARHFGEQPSARSARVVDIDSSGITIEWQWTEVSEAKPSTDDMRFAFREVTGAGSVLQEVSSLASEAHRALGLPNEPQLTVDKKEVDAKSLVDFSFKLPGVLPMAGVLLGLCLVGYLALVSEVHPGLVFMRRLISQTTCYHILVTTLIVHALEAGAVYAFCYLLKTIQPQQMNTENQIKWTIGGAVFGIFCLHDFISRVRRQFMLAGAR